MNFLELLKFLSAFGPKLKELWPKIQVALELAKEVWAIVQSQGSEAGTLSVVAFDVTEQSELDAVADALGGPTAAVDLSGLIAFGSLLKSTIGKASAMILWKILDDMLNKKG
jgi:hypothetical protein